MTQRYTHLNENRLRDAAKALGASWQQKGYCYLKDSGLCITGGIAKNAIENGHVTVDGELECRKGCKIRPGQKFNLMAT